MTISADSYGTAAGVAGRVTSLTTGAAVAWTFDTGTVPTLANVEAWINQFSGYMNLALEAARFTTPITQAACLVAVTGVVEDAVADMCGYSRGVGRFFSDTAQNSGKSAQGILRKEIFDWVEMNAQGMENKGAERNPDEAQSNTLTVGISSIRYPGEFLV